MLPEVRFAVLQVGSLQRSGEFFTKVESGSEKCGSDILPERQFRFVLMQVSSLQGLREKVEGGGYYPVQYVA